MKILVLNCGSSSIKYKLFDMTSGEVMAQGGIEKIGLPGAFLKLTDKDGKKVVIEREIPGHQEGIEFILSVLTLLMAASRTIRRLMPWAIAWYMVARSSLPVY